MRLWKSYLARSEPRNVAHYRHSFGVKLSFNAEQTAVAFPRRMLDQPIARADARRRTVLDKQVRSLLHAGDVDLVTQLRRDLRVALLRGHVSSITIAAQLCMIRRTLDRRLHASGLQFQEALDETRCEYAQQITGLHPLEPARRYH